MDEVVTVDEIKDRFPAEWILLADPEVDRYQRVVRGRVVCHSKDRDEVDQTAIALKLKSSASLYTGTIPEGTAIVV